jgi:DNA polymerase elongation subunit (family B)
MESKVKNIQPYKFYFLDYSPEQQLALYYYKERINKDNYTVDQHIKKIFLDIEVFTEFENKFPEPKHANKPINAVTLINDKCDIDILFLLHKDIKNFDKEKIVNNIIRNTKEEYGFEIKNINLHVFDDESSLIYSMWNIIHNYDPTILLGFNSDYFDFPYIVRRTINVFGYENAAQLITKFNEFNISGFNISIPDFQLVDILKMYKPGEGFGFGKNLEKFNLDTVAEEELGVKKVEHENISLDELYIKYPERFIYYNMIDTYLIYMLDKKLKHFDLFNTQRRITYCPASRAYHGRSVMGEQIQTYNMLVNENKVPRAFLVKEKYAINDNEDEFKKYSLSLSYYGAYVRDPIRGIYDGLVIDLDQSLTRDQLIIIKRGNNIFEIPIGEYTPEEIDETLTLDKNNRVTWKKVKGHITHRCKYNVLKIITENNNCIKVTNNHSIFVFNKGTIYIKLASDLKYDDKLVLCDEKGNLIFERIKNIEDLGKFHYVYDISVEETERFFARDPESDKWILVHNTSMYPSLIKMYNMEYSTYKAKLYNSTIYNFIDILRKFINNEDSSLTVESIVNSLQKYLLQYLKEHTTSYNDYYKKNTSYITEMLKSLKNSGLSFEDIISNKNYYLLKTKLIPLLEIVELILSNEYNEIIYDYLFMDEDKFLNKYKNTKFYLLENPTDSYSQIKILTLDELLENYLKKYIVTITGCLFIKHSEKTGYIIQLINKLMKERKQLKSKLKELDPNSKDYELLYRAQLSIKVLLNSLYGIYGLTTYRYNEKNIANTITISGRVLIKTAQYVADKTIQEFKNKILK